MAEKLQGLLEKIQRDGLDKAEQEKAKIIAEAKKQAENIVAEAKAKAENMHHKAETDANNLRERAEAAIRQASRDIVLKLREELEKRLENIVRDQTAAAMTPEFMGNLIMKMAAAFKRQDAEEPTLEILVAPADLEPLRQLLKGSLAKSFKNNPQAIPAGDVSSGLKLGVKGEDLFLDFTDDAVADLICEYIGERLTEIIKS